MAITITVDTDKYFIHDNSWWWGVSISIIRNDGAGMVEVQLDREMPETVYIKGLSVLREKRRQGVATELLCLCEDIARNNGKALLRLSVDKSNGWLFEWYKRLGFHILATDDSVYEMIKPLSI